MRFIELVLLINRGIFSRSQVWDRIISDLREYIEAVEWETIVAGPFRIGHFIGALITFLIVAFVIFLLVKITKRWGIE